MVGYRVEIVQIYNKRMKMLIQGDSAKILKEIPSQSIDLCLTSPPYDDARDYNGYSFEFEVVAKELFRVIKMEAYLCGWWQTRQKISVKRFHRLSKQFSS